MHARGNLVVGLGFRVDVQIFNDFIAERDVYLMAQLLSSRYCVKYSFSESTISTLLITK